MVRANERAQIALNGTWRFAVDPENAGREAGWASGPPGTAQVIDLPVPGIWEQAVPGYDGVAWYWRQVDLDAAALGDRVARLRFGAVNYFAEVWINGEYAGSHEGGYTPFAFDVTHLLRAGTNNLAVRVIDPPKDEVGIDGIVLKETPCWRELESFNFGGIWQDVSLVLTPHLYLADCFVRPRLTPATAEVRLEVENRRAVSTAVTVGITVRPCSAGEDVATARIAFEAPPGASAHVTTVPVDAPRLWSPETPNLYDIEIVLTSDAGRDTLVTRFGFRELTLGEDGFLLNGTRTFLKGGFHEGFYPLTIAAPHDPAMVRRELAEAKRAGLNLLRFWQIPIHPLVLDLADEMGMLLMDEPPIEWLADSPHAERRCRQEVRELVRRDRNHPSVVFWTILNEGGILPEFTRRGPAQFTAQEWVRHTVQRLRHDLCLEARALDPSRLVIDDSGGWVNGANVYLPDSIEPRPVNDLHLYRRAPTNQAAFEEFKTLGARDEAVRGHRVHRVVRGGLPVLVSEFGYGSLPDFPTLIDGYRAAGAREDAEDFVQLQRAAADLERIFREQRLDDVFPSVLALCLATQQLQAEGNRRQMEALRANPLVGGYVIHAFSAGGVILCAEMVDLWRNPKPVCDEAALVHRPLHPVIELWPRVVRPGVPLPVRVTMAADDAGAAGGEVGVEIAVEDTVRRPPVFRDSLALRGPVTPVPVSPLAGVPVAGDYQLVVSVQPGGGAPVEAQLPFLVLDPPPWEHLAGCVGVVSSAEARISHFLAAHGVDADDGVRANDRPSCIIVTAPARTWPDPVVGSEVKAALAAAEAGGTALFLAPLAPGDEAAARALLPWLGAVRPAVGNWIPVAHYVRRHAFFDGLPAPGLMDWRYVDVCPTATLVDTPADEVPAGSVSLHATIYEKPETAWAGADLVVRRHGRGRVVLSQLALLDQLGANPLAERIVFNLLRWALGGAG